MGTETSHRMPTPQCGTGITLPLLLSLLGLEFHRIGVKQEVGYALARLSLLKTLPTVIGRRSALGVCANSIEKFRAEHVFAHSLAKLRGSSSTAVAAELAGKGINPVASQAIGNCRQIVYRRADLLSVEWIQKLISS